MAGARPGGGRGRAEEAAPPNRRLHLAPQRKLGGIASCPPPQSGSCLCARGTCAMPPAPGPPKLPHVDPRRGLAQDWLDSAPPLTHFLARCMWASFAPSPRFGLLAIVVSVYTLHRSYNSSLSKNRGAGMGMPRSVRFSGKLSRNRGQLPGTTY